MREWNAHVVAGILSLAICGSLAAAEPVDKSGEEGKDSRALRMLRRGAALMADRQEERAVKVLAAIPRTFPTSPARFEALLLLGKHYIEKGEAQLAIKTLAPVAESEESAADERAEAIYRTGICWYNESDYSRALATLRQVADRFPWSVYANEAYYYIGLCHFELKRWGKAIDALKLVGTSVPPNEDGQTLVEGGQRFLVKVHDKDLRVALVTGDKVHVSVRSGCGDVENLELGVFDDEGEVHLGMLKMDLGTPVPGDGKLQIRGGDTVVAEYVDRNTREGAAQVKRLGSSRVVSTAVVGFMDGAYREYVHGVFADQQSFLRVKDLDRDSTDAADSVKVKLYAEYRPEDVAVPEDGASTPSIQEYVVRDVVDAVLTESAGHSGYFQGTLVVEVSAHEKRPI